MNFLSGMAGQKHPDNMTRADMIKKIKSFETDSEASSWWMKYALVKVSKNAFRDARTL